MPGVALARKSIIKVRLVRPVKAADFLQAEVKIGIRGQFVHVVERGLPFLAKGHCKLRSVLFRQCGDRWLEACGELAAIAHGTAPAGLLSVKN